MTKPTNKAPEGSPAIVYIKTGEQVKIGDTPPGWGTSMKVVSWDMGYVRIGFGDSPMAYRLAAAGMELKK